MGSNSMKRDLIIIAISIVVAVVLMMTGALERLMDMTRDVLFLNSFVSGFFFTSIFTTAPAIVSLGKISLSYPIYQTAFFGALGAMCGDFVIFQFVRDRFSTHIFELVKIKGAVKRLQAHLKLKHFRWLMFLLGGLIIASPLPDELGLSILGFSKMRTPWFLLLSFVFNFIGIVVIGLIAGII